MTERGWYFFRLGAFTFRYDILWDYLDGGEVELDLNGVAYRGEALRDVDLDAIHCEHVYDLALAEFKKVNE